MKKPVALLSLFALIISGCQSAPLSPSNGNGNTSQPAEMVSENQTMDASYKWTPELMKQFIEQEDANTVAFSGPFYFGSFEGMDEYTKSYSKARDQKVEKILAVVDEQIGYLNELDEKIKEIRNIMDWYFLTVATYAPAAQEELLQQMDKSNEYAIYNFQKLAFLNALKTELAKAEKNAEWGFLAYTKYYLTFSLTQSYQEELAFLYGRLAGLEMITDSYKLEGYKKINTRLDEAMGKRSEEIELLLYLLTFNGASLAHEEKGLFTADYYYTKDVVANMKAKLPELKKTLADYKGGKQEITQEFLDGVNEQVAVYEEFSGNLQAWLDSVPPSDLLTDPEFKVGYKNDFSGADDATLVPVAFVPVARAGIYDTYKWVKGGVTSAAGAVIDVGATGASMAWNGTKAVVGKAAEVTVSGVKIAGKGIGTVLDTASATVKAPMDLANGLYYGNSAKDILNTVGDNYVGVYNNFQNGLQGHQVYSDTVKILEESEKITSQAMEGLTKAIVGEGITSKTVGFASKIVAGFFTGLAKDTMIALDPNTSTSDTLVSMFGVGLSMIGGSGSFLKGSQSLKIAGSKLLSGGSKMLSTLGAIDAAAIKGGLTNLFKGGLKGAFSSMVSKQGLVTAFESTKSVLSSTKNGIMSALENGYNVLKGNAMENVPGALKGLFEKKKMLSVFADVLGIGEGAGAGFTNKALSFLNNIVGSLADDKLKSWLGDSSKFLGVSSQTQEEINDEALQAELQAVQKVMIGEMSKQLEAEAKALAEEYQKARDAGTLGPFMDLLVSLLAAVAPGSYGAQVNVNSTMYGATTTGGGPITFSVDKDFNISCTSTLKTKMSGTLQGGITTSGSATAEAVGCKGSVDPKTGDYKVGGTFNSTGTAVVSAYGTSKTNTANMSTPFTATGNMKGGVISGSANVGSYIFSITPTAYSEI
jgi:hypothetical protein